MPKYLNVCKQRCIIIIGIIIPQELRHHCLYNRVGIHVRIPNHHYNPGIVFNNPDNS